MPKQTIGVGSSANDGTGDTLRVALQKVNDNTDTIYRQGFKNGYPPGSIIGLVGDSNTQLTGFSDAYNAEWTATGGAFYGCTIVNHGQGGSQILDWKNSIDSGDQEATDRVEGTVNIWAMKNQNPDLIIISLGTNEMLSAAQRALQGSPTTMQANFDTLIEWLLENTDADILLRMPQPYAFKADSIYADWATADETATYSAQLRTVHLECSEINNPRVRLYDSHKCYFGYRIDAITDLLDPETGLEVMSDELHLNPIGYKQTVRQMSDLIQGSRNRSYESLPDSSLDAQENAVWSETVWVNSVNTGAQGVLILMDPMCRDATLLDTRRESPSCTLSEKQQLHLPAIRALSEYGIYHRLTTAGETGGEAKMFCKFYESGNVYSFSKLTLQSTQVSTEPYYFEVGFENLQNYAADTSATLQSTDKGRCLFWVEDIAYAPKLTRSEQKDSLRFFLNDGTTWNAAVPVKIYPNTMYKFKEAWNQVVVTAWCYKAPSGGSCTCQWTLDDFAKAPSGIVFADGSNDATIAGLGPINISAGSVMYLEVSANPGNAGSICIELSGTRALY